MNTSSSRKFIYLCIAETSSNRQRFKPTALKGSWRLCAVKKEGQVEGFKVIAFDIHESNSDEEKENKVFHWLNNKKLLRKIQSSHFLNALDLTISSNLSRSNTLRQSHSFSCYDM